MRKMLSSPFPTFPFGSRNLGKFLVCDLQGELDETRSPQTFFLTDPVIHYASRHRTAVYGRTDHGRKGIANFFDTHVCNAVCKALGFDKYVPI